MDIGREVKKISRNTYSLRFLIKENEKKEYKSKERIGNIIDTNVDGKERIYIPKGLIGIDVFGSRTDKIRNGILSLNTFQFITLFLDTETDNEDIENIDLFEDENNQKLFKGEKRLDINLKSNYTDRINEEIPDIKKHLEEYKERRAKFLNRVYERTDVKVKINITSNPKRKNPLEFFPEMKFGIEFTPYLEKVDLHETGRKKKYKGYFLCNPRNIRYRIKIPKLFLDFCGIDKDKDKILLFYLENEIEIWKKERWKDFINEIVWLSEEGKFIIDKGGNIFRFISIKDNQFLKLMMI